MSHEDRIDPETQSLYEYLSDELSEALYDLRKVSPSEVNAVWNQMREDAEDEERAEAISSSGLKQVMLIMEENGGEFAAVVRKTVEEGWYDEEDD